MVDRRQFMRGAALGALAFTVGGAQVLRRDDDAVGLGRAEAPAQQRMRVDEAEQTAERAAPDEHGEPKPLRDRKPHHEGAHPQGRDSRPPRTIAKGCRTANMPEPPEH